jgi:hypothetical protein
MKLNRNMINEMINTFCKITTVIFIACCLRSGFFTKIEEFYSVFDVLSILSIALISVLLTLPFYSQKERSKKTFLLMQIAYYIEVNISTLIIGFLRNWFSFENIKGLLSLEIIITLTYGLVMFLNYIAYSSEAKKMNAKLKERNVFGE